MKITETHKQSVPFDYAYKVLSGEINTGEKIKKAVHRFFDWIKTADEDGYVLDHESGMHVLLFFEKFVKHTKGKLSGKAFRLEPYQQFTVYNIFAWKDLSGNRRIKTVYEKVARKNGKTALLSGIGLYMLTFDEESSPEIYVGATKEAQAKILWEQAYDMVYKSQPLRLIGVKNTQREIRFSKNMGKFRFLGGDSKTQDGLNPSFSIIDEYHAHKDDSVREVLESAMGARTNPLIYLITTAGFNTHSVCKQAEDVYNDILSGTKKDDNTFIMIHDLDENDDWEDVNNWFKANPNLGVSISLDYLESEFTKAKNQPSKIPNFKTKHLNMWVDAAEVRIPDYIWDKSSAKVKIENFTKYGCAGAFDLSSTTDLSSLVYVSNPDEEGVRDVLAVCFCPKDTIDKRSKEDRVPYRQWSNEKLINYIDTSGLSQEDVSYFDKNSILIATPGNVIDYSVIQDQIKFTYKLIQPKWYDYDPWSATKLVQDLEGTGIEMHPFPQTITHFSYPTKEFEKLAYQEKIRHGGNPLLKWMLSGCVAITDPNENIRYSKKHSTKRIDAIIATIMALAGTITTEETNDSKYNNDNEEIYI